MNAKIAACLACAALPAGFALAQEPSPDFPPSPAGWEVPRTAWGDPDFTGIWPVDLGRTPMQRAAQYGDRRYMTEEEYAQAEQAATDLADNYEAEDAANTIDSGHWFEWGRTLRQTSLIVEPANGRIPPLTAEGEARKARMTSSWTQETFDSIADFNALDRCITRGMPASMIPFPYNNGIEVFQAPGFVALNLEMVHETRIIPLEDGPALPQQMDTWLGNSRGHWEGDTLVIETTNFNGESPMVIVGPSNQPVPTSDRLRVVERLTMVGPDTIRYEAVIEDPVVLTAPFRMEFPWTRNEDYGIFEYACHEGNTVVRAYILSTSPRFAEARENGEGLTAQEFLEQQRAAQ